MFLIRKAQGRWVAIHIFLLNFGGRLRTFVSLESIKFHAKFKRTFLLIAGLSNKTAQEILLTICDAENSDISGSEDENYMG